jgi:hypoxanthine-DNA glycosylase
MTFFMVSSCNGIARIFRELPQSIIMAQPAHATIGRTALNDMNTISPKRSFAPVVDPHIRLLVLGSLPGEVSLARSRYYAHPQNQFWRLIGQVIGEDLQRMEYERRLTTLLAHRIGLWDVVAQAHRDGSLDSRIRGHSGNDVAALAATLPELRAIAFNGGTAAKIGLRHLGDRAARYRIFTLPSSSPAYTRPFEEKFLAWQALREALDPAAAQVPPARTSGAG